MLTPFFQSLRNLGVAIKNFGTTCIALLCRPIPSLYTGIGYSKANPKEGVDGTGLLTFLATFGIVQLAGLLALIREQDEKKLLVLILYSILAIGTIAIIWWLILPTA